MAERTHEFSRYAEVVAALADPALAPIAPAASAQAEPDAPGTAAWLRTRVARFSHGPQHASRRAVVEAEIARLDPVALRKAAAAEAGTPAAEDDPRVRTARLLAGALGLADPERAAADVGIVSGVYFGGDDPAADAAVARLVEAYTAVAGPASAEELANRISVLIQAYDATGSLVERAAAHLTEDAGGDVERAEAVVVETLRHDPPVQAMRRIAVRETRAAGVDIAEGDLVTLLIPQANRDPEVFDRPDEFDPSRPASPHSLTFGSDPRRCPGHAQAVALAAGILASAPTGQGERP